MSEFFERVGTEVQSATPRENSSSNARLTPAGASSDKLPPTGRRWSRADDVYWQAADTQQSLDPAFYRMENYAILGPVLKRSPVPTDGLIRLPDTVGDRVVEEFRTFWTLGDQFRSRNFLHKRGILLWGPPGSGKTAALMLMAQTVINEQGGIVVQIERPDIAAACLAMIRKIEPKRPIVALIEDIDALVHEYGENGYLGLLDGETQIDRICYVATTNYPERLDARFVDRPSRFDTVEYIGVPTPAARRTYLAAKDPELDAHDLDRWVAETEGFSVAHLRELIILVRCFDRPLISAIQRLEKMRLRPSSEKAPDRPAFGIVR